MDVVLQTLFVVPGSSLGSSSSAVRLLMRIGVEALPETD